MRPLLALMGCCITLSSLGQATQQSLRVQITYEKAGQYLEQAIATIEADNVINSSTTVEYKAGRSITMSPGFEARTGSTFLATIQTIDVGSEGDDNLKLMAFPNPFEQTTTVEYYLPADGKVTLWITDMQGKTVRQLIYNEYQTAGNHRVEWNAESVSSGVYVSVLEANKQKVTSRIVKK